MKLPIKTQFEKIPWSWVALMALPVGMSAFVEKCSGMAMTFTLKKFISDPAAIMFIGSINVAFGVLVAPWIAWKSDSVGRRKPFIIAGLCVLAMCLVGMPLATSMWMLLPIILLYQFSMDFGYTGPWKPLYFDVVPDHQRGRGMVINRYVSVAARLVFMYFLIGRFDKQIGMKKLSASLAGKSHFYLTGEQLIYFLGAALVVASIFFIGFGVKENRPIAGATGTAGPRQSIGRFLKDMFGSPTMRLLCLPVIASVLMSAKLASLRPLLYTEQFGYTKQTMGNIHTISMIFNAVIILPILAIMVDRINRLGIFLFCLAGSTLQPIAFWVYVHYFAPGQVPSPTTIIAFHIADATFDHAALIALWPMVFKAVDKNSRGAANGAFLIVAGITAFVSRNVLGLWVKWFSAMTCPEGTYDYMSGYLYIFGVGVIGCLATLYYAKKSRSIKP